MEMDAKKANQPTWETVRYMVAVIQYGGRITDDFDQLLMDTFAEKYFQPGVCIPDSCDLRGACPHVLVSPARRVHVCLMRISRDADML